MTAKKSAPAKPAARPAAKPAPTKGAKAELDDKKRLAAAPAKPVARAPAKPAVVEDPKAKRGRKGVYAPERGTIGQGINGLPNDNLTGLDPGRGQANSIRVLSLDPAIQAAEIESALSRFDVRWATSMTWNTTDQKIGSPFQNVQVGNTGIAASQIVPSYGCVVHSNSFAPSQRSRNPPRNCGFTYPRPPPSASVPGARCHCWLDQRVVRATKPLAASVSDECAMQSCVSLAGASG